jgi:uncharacterized lipoprotein YmbA
MRKLTAFAIALLLTSCSGTSLAPTTPHSTECRIPALPPLPKLSPVEGCLSVEETVALAKYLARADETRRALAGCSLVQLEAL